MTFRFALALVLVLATACGGGPAAPPPVEADSVGPTSPRPAENPPTPFAESAPPTPAEPTARTPSTNRSTARPAPAERSPGPSPVVSTVSAGTLLDVVFLEAVSSETSVVGDSFRARVVRDVFVDDVPVIPGGSVVEGIVTEVVPVRKIGGRAKLAVEFQEIVLTTGVRVPLRASFAAEGRGETKRDAATIGGAAAGGALLGRVLGKKHKDRATAIGAVVGAAAGTAVAANTPGEPVEIAGGTEISILLDDPIRVTTRP